MSPRRRASGAQACAGGALDVDCRTPRQVTAISANRGGLANAAERPAGVFAVSGRALLDTGEVQV
jgi:hypothetical protein